MISTKYVIHMTKITHITYIIQKTNKTYIIHLTYITHMLKIFFEAYKRNNTFIFFCSIYKNDK